MGKFFHHLTHTDRLRIETLLLADVQVEDIAQMIGVAKSTVYREIKRGTYCHRNSDWTEETRYSPEIAEQKYRENLREKGRGLKVGNDYEFVEYVEDKIIHEKFSPAAVLAAIRRECRKFRTEVCLSTLYNYIRSEDVFLNVTLKELPERASKARKRRKKKVAKRAAKGDSIEKRPKDIETRENFGYWEMDTVVGPIGASKCSLLVLTERKTRKEIVRKINRHTAEAVVKALDRLEREFGERKFREIFKTITVDNGTEFSDVQGIERSRRNKKKRTKVYYCHPYSSYERGSNENQNKLIRRHIPKGVNFDGKTSGEIKEMEDWINNYPRALLNWRTSEECYQEEVKKLFGTA